MSEAIEPPVVPVMREEPLVTSKVEQFRPQPFAATVYDQEIYVVPAGSPVVADGTHVHPATSRNQDVQDGAPSTRNPEVRITESGSPILQNETATILTGGETSPQTPVSNAPDVSLVESGNPINQDQVATIMVGPPILASDEEPPPRTPVSNAHDVTMVVSAGVPVQLGDGVVFASRTPDEPAPRPPTILAPVFTQDPSPSVRTGNEPVEGQVFQPRGAMYNDASVFIPPAPAGPVGGPVSNEAGAVLVPGTQALSNADVFLAASGGGPGFVNNASVQFLPGKPTMHVTHETTIGGGGDLTRQAGGEGVTFGACGAEGSPVNVGQNDTFLAQDAQVHHVPGSEAYLAPVGEAPVQNQDYVGVKSGAEGAPVHNIAFNDNRLTSKGKPIKAR